MTLSLRSNVGSDRTISLRTPDAGRPLKKSKSEADFFREIPQMGSHIDLRRSRSIPDLLQTTPERPFDTEHNSEEAGSETDFFRAISRERSDNGHNLRKSESAPTFLPGAFEGKSDSGHNLKSPKSESDFLKIFVQQPDNGHKLKGPQPQSDHSNFFQEMSAKTANAERSLDDEMNLLQRTDSKETAALQQMVLSIKGIDPQFKLALLKEIVALQQMIPSRETASLPKKDKSEHTKRPDDTPDASTSLGRKDQTQRDRQPEQTEYQAELPGNDAEMGLDRSVDATDTPTRPSWKTRVWEKSKDWLTAPPTWEGMKNTGKWWITPPDGAPELPALVRGSTSFGGYANYLEKRLRRALLTPVGYAVGVSSAIAIANSIYPSYVAGRIVPESVASMYGSALAATGALRLANKHFGTEIQPYDVLLLTAVGTPIGIGITKALYGLEGIKG